MPLYLTLTYSHTACVKFWHELTFRISRVLPEQLNNYKDVSFMEIREQVIVPLGYGKFVRSDKIVALEPIEDGPGGCYSLDGHGYVIGF
jgi:hypothetical protein